MVRPWSARVAALTCLVLLLFAVSALGDADPASDVLLGENVFYPYSPQVSHALQADLNAEVAAAHEAHFPLKVALISSPVDLGAIPTFFGKPPQYAAFLDQEIRFAAPKAPLLVVMPNGYGAAGLPKGAAAAVASLTKPSGQDPDALARAAIVAVPKLARAAGHPVAGAAVPPPSSGSGGSAVVPIVILVAVSLTLAALIVAFRWRRRRAR